MVLVVQVVVAVLEVAVLAQEAVDLAVAAMAQEPAPARVVIRGAEWVQVVLARQAVRQAVQYKAAVAVPQVPETDKVQALHKMVMVPIVVVLNLTQGKPLTQKPVHIVQALQVLLNL